MSNDQIAKSWQELRDQCVQREITERSRVKPITPGHERYLKTLKNSRIVVCTGPAGSGKTYISCGYAAQLLAEQKIKKIVVTRSMVTCGKGTGWLPGGIQEKFRVYVQPMLDALEEFMGRKTLEIHLQSGVVEMLPLDLMRGASLKDTFVICDECQNWEEMNQAHMLLTRIGRSSKLVCAGDVTRTQTDIRHQGMNPLKEVILRFEKAGVHPAVGMVQLTHADVVRESFTAWVDQTLTAPLEELGRTDYADEPWFDLDCPECRAALWYIGTDHENDETEHVECYGCFKTLALWRGNDFDPHAVPADRRLRPAATYPEQP